MTAGRLCTAAVAARPAALHRRWLAFGRAAISIRGRLCTAAVASRPSTLEIAWLAFGRAAISIRVYRWRCCWLCSNASNFSAHPSCICLRHEFIEVLGRWHTCMTTTPCFHTLARVAPIVAIALLGCTNDARVAALWGAVFFSGAVPTVSVVVVVVEVVVVWTVCHHSGVAPCWSDAGTRCAVLIAFTRFCGSNLFALIAITINVADHLSAA